MKTLMKHLITFIYAATFAICILSVYHLKLDKDIVEDALSKQEQYDNTSDYILYIDLEYPIFFPRLYLINVKEKTIEKRDFVFTSYKSGLIYATKYSNVPNTNLTSTGAFNILNDYTGNFGYSARIKGLDNNNNNVTSRAIVLHPWKFNPYTLGCYSTTKSTLDNIIPLLKHGGFMYVNKN